MYARLPSTAFSFACFLLVTKIHTVPGTKLVSTAIYLDCVNWSWTWTQLIATELEQTDMKSLQAQFPGPLSLKRSSDSTPGAFSMPKVGALPNQKVPGGLEFGCIGVSSLRVCDRLHREETRWSHRAGLQRRLCFRHHLAHGWHSLAQHDVD